MIRVKTTSNIKQFNAFMKNLPQTLDDAAEAVAKSLLLSSFEIVLSNSPADTGQFIKNWHVYKHGGLRGFTPGGSSPKHDRYDAAGRAATQAATATTHMAVLEAELASLDLKFFSGAVQQVTIGLSNATPYGDILDQGGYTPKMPLVNVTASGYSVQAPNGIVQVSISEARNTMGSGDFGQFLNVGGSV